MLFLISALALLSAGTALAEDWESVTWSAEGSRVEEFSKLCLERGLTSADIFWANGCDPGALPPEGDVLLFPKSKSALLPTWLEVQGRKAGGSAPMVTVKLHGTAQVPQSESEPMVTVPLHPPAGGSDYANMTITVSGDTVVVGTQPGKTGKISKMMWPVDGEITSGFGRRSRRRMHHGIDIPMPKGTPIAAAQDGVVSDVGTNRDRRYRGYGNVVLVDHGGGIVSMYSHCASISVKKGQKVRRGDVVGTVGDTGRTTTHHVHFEIRKNGKPVDPIPYLAAR